MTRRLGIRLANQVRAVWKFFLSFRKRDWELSDYPISVRKQESNPKYEGTRCKLPPFVASILNWHLTGCGDSESEAVAKLEEQLTAAKVSRGKEGKALPRPGRQVPIEFASQEQISAHPELVQDFVSRVLEFEWAWISDESSLWDFHCDATNEANVGKIKAVYGVDVSDIESAKVSEILERIATAHKSP